MLPTALLPADRVHAGKGLQEQVPAHSTHVLGVLTDPIKGILYFILKKVL